MGQGSPGRTSLGLPCPYGSTISPRSPTVYSLVHLRLLGADSPDGVERLLIQGHPAPFPPDPMPGKLWLGPRFPERRLCAAPEASRPRHRRPTVTPTS